MKKNSESETKIQQWLSNVAVGIECTTKCNLSCKHCMSFRPKADDLPLKYHLDILRRLASCGIKKVSYTGGEPTMHKDLTTILAYGLKLGLDMSVATNAFTESSVLERILESTTGMVTSIDGLEEYHDEFRGHKGSFRKVINLLQLCEEYKKPLFVNCTVTPRNFDQLDGIFELCIQNCVRVLRTTPVMCIGRGKSLDKSYFLSEIEKKDLMEWTYKKNGIALGRLEIETLVSAKSMLLRHPCKIGACSGEFCHAESLPSPQQITILNNGTVMPFNGYLEKSYTLGNCRQVPVDVLLRGFLQSDCRKNFLTLTSILHEYLQSEECPNYIVWQEKLFSLSQNKNDKCYLPG